MAQIFLDYSSSLHYIELIVRVKNLNESNELKRWILARKAEEPRKPYQRRHTFRYKKLSSDYPRCFDRYRLWFEDESEATAFKIMWQD